MRAAQFVEDGDKIFISASYTALLMLSYITAKNVTLFTNNTNAIGVTRRADMKLILIGGELNAPVGMLTGEVALNSLRSISLDKSFLGCHGISAQRGITTSIPAEAAVNDLILERTSGKKILLADRTEVGRNATFICGKCDRVSCLITDSLSNKGELRKLRRHMAVLQIKIPTEKNPVPETEESIEE
ncbi:MAG: hypothetical protein LBP21_02960 [Synergistaceae bacterium]|jgi:DeoR/GlpR family transcriptional regulator of sugar metabolism|nr:hypothetical protein [Synergistaceae bacterium]